MAAQPSKDGRLGSSPQNSYAGRHPEKRFVQGIAAFHQCSILPEVGELMVNNQQYDSHVGRFRQVSLECFIVDRSTPCLRGVGVKARSGKEDTTLLSMADCRVKQETVSTATRYGIKPRIQGCPRGSVRMGGQSIRVHKKKMLAEAIDVIVCVSSDTVTRVRFITLEFAQFVAILFGWSA